MFEPSFLVPSTNLNAIYYRDIFFSNQLETWTKTQIQNKSKYQTQHVLHQYNRNIYSNT